MSEAGQGGHAPHLRNSGRIICVRGVRVVRARVCACVCGVRVWCTGVCMLLSNFDLPQSCSKAQAMYMIWLQRFFFFTCVT